MEEMLCEGAGEGPVACGSPGAKVVEVLKKKVFEGGEVTREEALALAAVTDKAALYEAAGEIRDRFAGRYFDTCSIVNARSDRKSVV